MNEMLAIRKIELKHAFHSVHFISILKTFRVTHTHTHSSISNWFLLRLENIFAIANFVLRVCNFISYSCAASNLSYKQDRNRMQNKKPNFDRWGGQASGLGEKKKTRIPSHNLCFCVLQQKRKNKLLAIKFRFLHPSFFESIQLHFHWPYWGVSKLKAH